MKQEKPSEFISKSLVYNHIKYTDIEPFVIPPHFHDVFELLYVINGDLTYHVEGKKYQVKKNSLIITRPHLNHTIDVNGHNAYERFGILVENKIIKESILNRLSDDIDVLNLNQYPQISDIFKKTDYYTKHFEGDELKRILSNLVEEIFYNIIIASENSQHNESVNNYSANNIISAAIEYIDNNIATPFSVDTLCRELYVSKSYLHGLFMQHLQTTPKKHITSKRLLLAQSKIRAFSKSTNVYSECGFSDYSSFYRAYKKHFGYAPSEELDQKIYRVIEF